LALYRLGQDAFKVDELQALEQVCSCIGNSIAKSIVLKRFTAAAR